MLRPLIALAALLSTAAHAEEFRCEELFAPDTSHDRLAEAFGTDNVFYGEISDSEATFPLATVVYPDNPESRLSFVWQDDEMRATPLYAIIPEGSSWTVNGLRVGMDIGEVEELNGRPFSLGGYDDIGRGTVDSWNDGKLTSTLGPCVVSVQFSYNHIGLPLMLDDPINEQGPFPSDHPSYRALGSSIGNITVHFPGP
jgi:hypothetical protein